MRFARRLIALALVGALLYGAVQFTQRNPDEVVIDLLAGQSPPVALWLALVAAFGLGVLCAGGVGMYEVAKKSLVARRYRKAVAKLESEIHQLRNMPLATEGAGGGAGDAQDAKPLEPSGLASRSV